MLHNKRNNLTLSQRLLIAPILLYRNTLKPWIGMECRHLPTCSEFAIEAIEKNGTWRGFWLMFSRIARCHPFGTEGYDSVPDIKKVHHPFAPWKYGRWTIKPEKNEE